ncbi:hypothetical protein [Micromonospora sp. NPDC047074]|uniref:hypothetical protein n=1 Tax=Micromonospora sp. NPDC047074 TaxID=3154339 RepID=UPI0033C0B2FA
MRGTGRLAGPLLGGLIIDNLGDRSLWSACAVLGTVVAVGYCLLRGPLRATLHPTAPPVGARERELAHEGQG